MESLTEEVAQSIFDSLGSADASVSERASYARTIIVGQTVDIEKLESKLQKLKSLSQEKYEDEAALW